ncbi:ankyrin [Hypoxylon sp. NC0597]|nr:ankyrin [Hypoxylon sp. NC0597]
MSQSTKHPHWFSFSTVGTGSDTGSYDSMEYDDSIGDDRISISNNEPSPPTLHGLAPELILEIGSYLPQRDRAHLGQTCGRFYDIMTTSMHKEDARQDYHALWWACFRNCHSLLKKLLDSKPHLVNYRFQTVHTVNQGGISTPQVSRDLTPLIVTMLHGSYHVLLVLLRFGADVNLPDTKPHSSVDRRFYGHLMRWYPINWAFLLIHDRDLEHTLTLFIEKGANINQSPGRTLPAGSNTIIRNTQAYPTAAAGRLGADLKAIDPLTGHTPIFALALHLKNFHPWPTFYDPTTLRHDIDFLYDDHLIPHVREVLRNVIGLGVDFTTQCWEDDVSQSPLHLLCTNSNRYEELINILLEAGADINTTDSIGQTPIFRFMHSPPADVKILQRFIRNRAKINYRDTNLDTPLHVLCQVYSTCQTRLQQTIKAMLSRGANPTLRNTSGLTPRDILEARTVPVWPETLGLLREAEEAIER